jgi:tetratricopeptide (TPR) repeat protein
VQAFAEALEKASKGIPINTTPQSIATKESNPPPVKTIDYAALDALYDEGVKARAKGDLEHALLCWQKILDSAPNYLNGTLQTRVEGLKQELRPLYVERLRRKALTFNSARNWDKEIETWQALLQLAPQDSNAQEMRQHAQNNKAHEYLYTSAKRYLEQNNTSAAKAELKELETYAPRFGDPEHLHETLQRIEWEASKPIREEEAKRAQEIALAEAKKKTDTTLNNAIFSVFLLPCGLSGFVGLFTQSITLVACIAVFIAIIPGIFFIKALSEPSNLPKSTLVTKFVVGAIFSIGLAILVTWYASTFPSFENWKKYWLS